MLRPLLKFTHTMGAIGLMGSMATLLVLLAYAPDPARDLSGYALVRRAMLGVADWVFLPSLTLTLIGGLLAFAMTRGFHNAGWVLAKLATGILIFEYGFLGPMETEAARAANALAGKAEIATLARSAVAEWWSLWILLGVATANVVLGVWRPRFLRRTSPAAREARTEDDPPPMTPEEGRAWHHR
jgi:uncharacterized membrane protein